MKNHKMKTLLTLTAGIATLTGTQAGTILSSDFSGLTTANVTTTGLAGYGYISTANPSVNNGLFGSGSTTYNGAFSAVSSQGESPTGLTTVSGIDATLTEIRTALGAQTGGSAITFDSNTTYGAYGGFPGNAGDIWSLTFTNLAAGNYTISLYGGHNQTDRNFDVEAALTGAANDTQQSGAIGSLGSTVGGGGFTTFKYDIGFTAAADDDLTLTFGAISGSGGGAFLAGYTVAVPEPSTALLGGLGLLTLLRRRRA